jgi:protein translocase SecG subunit
MVSWYNCSELKYLGDIMNTFMLVIEFFVAAALIGAVLLHAAKGEGLGGIGGRARVFNSQKGLEAGLNKLTAILGAAFLGLAIILSFVLV